MSRFRLMICFVALLLLSACNAPKTEEPPAPAPEPVKQSGEFDSDSDGVVDSADMCSNTPLDSSVDADGCMLYAEEYNNENGYPPSPPPPPPPPPTTSPGPGSPPPCLTNPVTFECIADLPAFPWPIPKPSSYLILRDNELANISKTSIGEMTDSLESVLGQAGYAEFKYYNLPMGIAMATQLERVDEQGKPFPMPERWDINNISASLDSFSLAQLVRVLVGAEPGYYRVLVFVVIDKNQVIVFDEPLENEAAVAALANDGAITLPEDIREIPIADDFNLNVLVYEMARKRAATGAEIHRSGLSAKHHLATTNIQL